MQIAVTDIRPNPLQPREGKPEVSDLASSMALVGLIQPIIVTKNCEGYILLAGHRRLAAAKKLGWENIEADVVDAADPKTDIAKIMAENEQRSDLTGAERAAGLQTMMDLGWTDDEVKAASGADDTEIAAARTLKTAKKKLVDKMPKTASIEEMAALVEFEGTETYKALTDEVGTDQFFHSVAHARKERERRAKVEAAHKQLKDDGVRLIDREDTYYGKALRLSDGRLKVDPKKHTECPGHCAFVEYYGDIVYCCDHLGEHGIVTQGKGAQKTDEQKALDKLKREQRAKFRASAPLRQEFVMGVLNAKNLNLPLLNWCYKWAESHGIGPFEGHNSKAKDYTKSKNAQVRFMAICVSTAESAIENWVTYAGAVGQLGYSGDLVEYLKVLKKAGYKMSEHETDAMKADA